METADVLGLLVPLTFVLMLIVERMRPARAFPAIRGWTAIGLVFLVVMATISTLVPLLIPGDWLAQHRLLDGTDLGVIGGAVVGYLAVSLFNYAWHRSTHSFSLLWRAFHQLHHAPQRLDMPGAVVFHPLDIGMYVLISTVTATFVLGLDPVAAALTGYIAAFYSFFQHWNVRTPRWLGYFIQRPEAHCVHHRRGLHGYNYGDLPIWDILLGTFRNPKTFKGEVGFDAEAAGRIGAMLGLVDVNSAQYGSGSRGVSPANTPVVGALSTALKNTLRQAP
jgi:sterol desaturase/sphingolipid hydroxylase (fatty acid hydroxylase superfamily)